MRRYTRPLRSGYTTGACAAAAAKAATISLLRQRMVKEVRIDLPGGKCVAFGVKSCVFNHIEAACSVIKDAGDDPDVTDGAEIQATVSRKEGHGVSIDAGEGVGVVTKPGLEIPVGQAAINPVPREMITRSVSEAAGSGMDGKGLRVVISVPDGEKLARRTLNQRLGIVGGISILGTTGVVIPYSVSAYTACISQALDVAIAGGRREAVLTTGRRSEKFAQRELALPEECFVQAGDFIGYSLKECVGKGFDRVTVWGMMGKISKLASGYLYTNVSDSKIDISFLAEIAVGCGVPDEKLGLLRQAVTATHFRRMLPPEYLERFCTKLCLLAAKKCRQSVDGKLRVECVMTDSEGLILGRADVSG